SRRLRRGRHRENAARDKHGGQMKRILALVILGSVGPSAPVALQLERGDLEERLVLTGELEAASSQDLVVPRTREWQIQLRWLEADGTKVVAGQRVAEFDNSAFVADLEEKKLSAEQAKNELDKQRAQNAIATADKRFELEKARVALEKARVQAQ